MIFINNKYTAIYYQIIDQANRRPKPECYTEFHHIIPKSLGGTNDPDNIVCLTAREHFVCHKLLTKMVTGNAYYKMKEALSYFSNNRNRKLFFSSRDIALLREANAIASSHRNKGNKNYLYRAPADQQLKDLRSSNASSSRWVNDGVTEYFAKDHEHLVNNSGYIYGRLKMALNKMIVWDDDRRRKRSEEQRNRPLVTCSVCGKQSNAGVIAQFHNNNCKYLQYLTC